MPALEWAAQAQFDDRHAKGVNGPGLVDVPEPAPGVQHGGVPCPSHGPMEEATLRMGDVWKAGGARGTLTMTSLILQDEDKTIETRGRHGNSKEADL